MAENPLYEQRIAPPSTTGEIQDNQSLGLQLAKNQAEFAARRNAAGAFMQLAGAAETIGNVFTHKNNLTQQQTMLSELQQLDSEIGYVPENGIGGTGQLGNLNKNRNLLAEWQTQEGGEESEYYQNWAEARLSNLGQGLKGKWRDAFEEQARDKLMKANMSIDSMATTHAYNGIRMANQTKATESLQQPDIDNIGSSIASSLGEMDGRLALGVDAGVYDPQEAMTMIKEYEAQLYQAHYGAAARDIQDGTPWQDPATGETYGGLAGADEMLGDHLAAGDLTEQQYAALRTNLYEMDSAKYARGAKVQAEMSNTTYGDVMTEISKGNIPTVEEIMNLEAVNPAQTRDFNRVGDRGLASTLLSARDAALKGPTGDDDDFIWPDEVWRRHNDGTWDDTKFRSWLFNNGAQNYGLTQPQMLTILAKSRDDVNQGTYNAIDSYVKARYNSRIRDAKNPEEEDAIRAEMLRHSQGLTLAMYDDDITETQDVMRVLDNWANAEVASQIYKEYSKSDPGRTNAAEMVNFKLMRGEYMGLTGIPEYASDVLQVQSLHNMMTEELYGENNVLSVRNGNAGTPMEGRIVFKVRDGLDGNKEKWMMWDVVETDRGGLEEVAKELTGYDPFSGEIWNPAVAVELRTLNDQRLEADRADTAATRSLALTGKTFEEIVEITGKTPQEVNNDLAELAEVVVGAPIAAPETNANLDWYQKNVDGINLNRTALDMRIVAQAMSNEEQDVLYKSIYENIYDRMKVELLAETESLGIYRNNGKLRSSAESTISSRIAKYGLPDSYAEQVIWDVFEGNR